MMRPTRIGILLFVLLLTACAGMEKQAGRHDQQLGQQAAVFMHDGQYKKAALQYRALALMNPEQKNQLYLRSALAWLKAKNTQQAMEAWKEVDRSQLSSHDQVSYDLLEAEKKLDEGQPQQALTRLLAIKYNQLPRNTQILALTLRARAQTQTKHTWNAIKTRIQLDDLLQNEAKNKNREQIHYLFARLGPGNIKKHLQETGQNQPIYTWASLALNTLKAQGQYIPPELTQPVRSPVANGQILAGYRMPQKVALILPLSGTVKTAGQIIEQGFMSAYYANAANFPPTISVYDTGSTPEGAVNAYQQAVANGTDVVIGPLTHNAVSSVIQSSRPSTPLLALNRSHNSTIPDYVSEFALSPEEEASQVARHMQEQGLDKVFILTSENDANNRIVKTFTQTFTQKGGEIIQKMAFNSALVDYKSLIAPLHLKQANSENTGIFLVMKPSLGRIVMPQLRLAQSKLPVFSTSRIYTGYTEAIKNGDLDAITFTDAPWLYTTPEGYPTRKDIAPSLQAARGGSARLFAFGMDAWGLIPYLAWMHQHPGSYLDGASGRLTADGFGHIHRILDWVQFKHGIAQDLQHPETIMPPSDISPDLNENATR